MIRTTTDGLLALLLSFAVSAQAAAQLRLVPHASGFERPVGMVPDPLDPSVQYVLQKHGRIVAIRNGVVQAEPFIDLTAAVYRDEMGERGLVGLAFPPDHAATGRVYVFFSSILTPSGSDSVLARFTRSTVNPQVLDPASRFDLEFAPGQRFIPQRSGLHKGGKLTFGPDGFLYVPVGDGGPSFDPDGRGQDVRTLLGKILRIDVSVPDEDPTGYRVPPGNPFADPTASGVEAGAQPEIWALGVRNPWKISFDDPLRGGTGALLVADVGENRYEEINYLPAGAGGRNLGWSVREGREPPQRPDDPDDDDDDDDDDDGNGGGGPPTASVLPLSDPMFVYPHAAEWGNSITGGYVYRGLDLAPSLKGRYFFADFVTRRLFSLPLTLEAGTGEALPVLPADVLQHTEEVGGQAAVGRLSSIDVDARGELYLVDYSGGRVLKLVMDSDNDQLPDGWEAHFGLNAASAAGNDGAAGDPDADGRTNAQELADGTHPFNVAALTRYLAEGSSSSFFETTIGLANPGTAPAAVLLRFLRSDGQVITHPLTIAAHEHATVRPSDLAGLQRADFSTIVETNQQVVIERTMTWTPTVRYGSHAERALTAPSTTWYLAEGATHGAFDTFYLLENPGDTAATVEVAYLLPLGAPIVRQYVVPRQARLTIWVDDETPALADTDVSARITATNGVPIIVERAMYRTDGPMPFLAGHASAGVTSPSTHWFFAEGATGGFFDLYLLLANPGTESASVSVRYLLPAGAPVEKTYTIGPERRDTVTVKLEDPLLADAAVAMVVESTVPIVAERSMYWPVGNWQEAHNSPGATETGTAWVVAGAEEAGAFGAQTFVLIANTSATAGSARVTILREGGAPPLVRTFALPPDSRTNVEIAAFPEFAAARNGRFGVLVESLGETPAQIVVEHATYASDAAGTFWAAGSNAIATRIQ